MNSICPIYTKCNHKRCGDEFCIRRYKTERIYSYSQLNKNQLKRIPLYLDQVNQDITRCPDYEEFTKLADLEKNIESFVANGSNLYLHSRTTGNGKTSWAIRLLLAYADIAWAGAPAGCVILFISVPRFLLAIKENISSPNEYAQQIIQDYLKADLVVWDDIATKTATQFELDYLLRMINDRIYAGKSNIYTSNLSTAELSVALDERLASRIRGSIDIELHGMDKRAINMKNLKEDN